MNRQVKRPEGAGYGETVTILTTSAITVFWRMQQLNMECYRVVIVQPDKF